MESTARDEWATAERAAAAPYLNYPPTPWWYAPVVGLWAAALVAASMWWRTNVALFVPAVAVLVVLEGIFIGWMQRRHGALPLPGRGRPPREIAAAWRRYFVGFAVVVVVVVLLRVLAGAPAAAAAAFVLVTAGLVVYERSYATAAARARDRLG